MLASPAAAAELGLNTCFGACNVVNIRTPFCGFRDKIWYKRGLFFGIEPVKKTTSFRVDAVVFDH